MEGLLEKHIEEKCNSSVYFSKTIEKDSIDAILKHHNFRPFDHRKNIPNVPYTSQIDTCDIDNLDFGVIKMPVMISDGGFISGIQLMIELGETYTTLANNKIRYISYPGLGIIKSIEICNNGQTYHLSQMEMIYRAQMDISKKRIMLGQSETHYSEMFAPNGNFEMKAISDGFQTFKEGHGPMLLIIDLPFWFNEMSPMKSVDTICYITLANSNEILSSLFGGEIHYPKINSARFLIKKMLYMKKTIGAINNHFALATTSKCVEIGTSEPSGTIEITEKRIKSVRFAFMPAENSSHSQHWFKPCKITTQKIQDIVMDSGTPRETFYMMYKEEPNVSYLITKYGETIPFKISEEIYFRDAVPFWYSVEASQGDNDMSLLPLSDDETLKIQYYSPNISIKTPAKIYIIIEQHNIYLYSNSKLKYV